MTCALFVAAGLLATTIHAADAKPLEHPFPHRAAAPPLTGGVGWFNTSKPVELKQLRGKFVLLDFWTYCCINCMHILPELKKLEQAYPNDLVVIGVHSAKFDAEQDSKNIIEAVQRYEIEHPVVNDANHKIWDAYDVSSWPTLVVIDPEGQVVAINSGEIEFKDLDRFMKESLPYYKAKGLMNAKPLTFELEADKAEQTPLRFPGKILADEAGGRLFIADSNHHRLVIAKLNGALLDVIGAGQLGAADGDYATARFNRPQGMALVGETLYVADTENHLLRKIDLKTRQVSTIAGTGKQARGGWPGPGAPLDPQADSGKQPPQRFVGPPKTTAISSPWDLIALKDNLYIAMAGVHQIWKMPLDQSEIGPYAGNNREDVVDGPLLPPRPFELGFASFAQPSGLATDGKSLFVADSEGSSIRAVPLDPSKEVSTIVGTSRLMSERLFTFGDVDGRGRAVRLQHCLGVAYHEGKIYIADSYNDKIKSLDPATATVKTLAGEKRTDKNAATNTFREPGGLAYAAGKLYVADTNNQRIRTIDLNQTNRVATLEIVGLKPPRKITTSK